MADILKLRLLAAFLLILPCLGLGMLLSVWLALYSGVFESLVGWGQVPAAAALSINGGAMAGIFAVSSAAVFLPYLAMAGITGARDAGRDAGVLLGSGNIIQ